MTNHSSQSPRDRVLWILTEHGGQMKRSRLRAHTGMRYALLNPILEEMTREGKIRISRKIGQLNEGRLPKLGRSKKKGW
jgi:hypothetical protein